MDQVLDFLSGNYNAILKRLEAQMNEAAEELDFESAAGYRELLFSVQKVAQKQKITDSGNEDRDAVSYTHLDGVCWAVI